MTDVELFEQNGFSRFVDEPTFGKLIQWLVDNEICVTIYYDDTKYKCELVKNGYCYIAKGNSQKKALLKAIKELSASFN